MATLFVYWGEVRVGELEQHNPAKVIFRYEESYLAAEHARAISWSLPLQAEPHDGPHAMAWFANLLPEGEVRTHVAQELGVSERNDWALLAAIGGDCAGALTITGEPAPCHRHIEYRPLAWAELEERIASYPRPSLLALMQDGGLLRLSLAGAQDKLPVHFREGELSLPVGGAASSHLLKIATGGIPDLVQNEYFCLELARQAGLPVCGAEIAGTSTPVLLVERYDRAVDENGSVTRLHQEDFCQALGHGPDTKYENEGGPSMSAVFGVLREASLRPLPDKRDLLRLVLFNHLIGNADAHAKNFSLLYGGWGDRARAVLAPFYDLVSTAAYPALTTKAAQKIGGEYRPEFVKKRHWDRLAEDVGAKPRFLAELGLEMIETLAEVSGPLAARIGARHGGAETLDRILGVILRRAERMRGQLE